MGRVIGWLFVVGAAATFGFDVHGFLLTDRFQLRSAGELWFQLDPGSLNLVQVVLERHLWPPLWDPAFLTLLLQPASVLFAALGVIVLLISHWARR